MIRWIAGTLELSSKVRYGLTSRGVPLYRFIPYDRSLGPFAVGCQKRDIFYNVHAIVQPELNDPPTNTLPKANLIQLFGPVTAETEKQVLLYTYAYNNTKELRKYDPYDVKIPSLESYSKMDSNAFTFHIDPFGCRDVDDAITLLKLSDTSYRVWIHIADVSSWIPEDSPIDSYANLRSTSFYTPLGEAISPMLHTTLSEDKASLLPSTSGKPALSLGFTWVRGQGFFDYTWDLCSVSTTRSYTYEEASESLEELNDICTDLGAIPGDSHSWIQTLMILYNTKAGGLLKEYNMGILRKQNGKAKEKYEQLKPFLQEYPDLEVLCYESAEYCLSSDPNSYHESLNTSTYAYASSPLRRYVDLVNQRCLKQILFGIPVKIPPTSTLVDYMNKRQKQAKAFQRDLFFSTSLTLLSNTSVKGVVVSSLDSHSKYRVYVPVWKRIVKVYCLNEPPQVGSEVCLTWFDDKTQPNWKSRIVFSVE